MRKPTTSPVRTWGASLGALRAALSAAVLAVFLATPVLAFASEELAAEPIAAADEASGIGLLIPKLGEWIPMLLGFIILWIVLAKFGWPAFMGMIDKRAATIRDSLEKAELAKLESERLLAEQKAELEEARHLAAQIVADAKAAAEQTRAQITTQAREEAQAMLAKASEAIEIEKKAAIAQLQSSVADLSVAIAGRVIGTELSETQHRAVIERYLAEAGSLNAN
ncbi:MAG: F0F1 ATP synthase subunit B [Coriobacteriales bacterium]|jgi:F-type H+-transporting ATPase subunit b|nr:F0F1 ATP synthase subunit B [Coriobacteriales bacterium]